MDLNGEIILLEVYGGKYCFMRRLLSIIFYYLYRVDFALHLYFKKINPFYYFSSSIDKKRNIKIIDQVDEAFKNPNYGFSSLRAGGLLIGIVGVIFWGIFSWLLYFCGIGKYHLNLITILTCLIISIVYTYNVFRDNQYLKYFINVSKFSTTVRAKWIFFTILFVVGGFIFGVISSMIITLLTN